MDQKINYIFQLSGNKHYYQYRLVLISFFIYMNVHILSQSISLFEKAPEITYFDKNLQKNITKQINAEICEWKNKYEITKEFKHSIISFYKSECNTFLIGLFGSALFLGNLLGTFSFSVFVDRIGRKKLIKICFIPYIISIILILFSPSFISMIIYFFISEFFALNIALSVIIINTENCHSYVRPYFSCFISCGFALCGITSSLYSKYFGDWRYIISISFFFSLTFISLFLFLINESPTFFLNKKDLKNFLNTLTEISIVNKKFKEFEENVLILDDSNENNKSLKNFFEIYFLNFEEKNNSEDTFNNSNNNRNNKNAILVYDENTKIQELNSGEDNFNKKKEKKIFNFFDFFRYKSIRCKFLTWCFIYSTVSGCYYGLSINIKNLSGDIYENAIINYSLEILVYILEAHLSNNKFLGRKKTCGMFFIFANLGFFMFLVFDFNEKNKNFILYGTRFVISGLYSSIGTFTLETYPTPARALGYGINNSVSKFVPVITPVIIEVFPIGIFWGYLSAVFISFLLLVFILEETIGKPLKEVIEEEEIEIKKNFTKELVEKSCFSSNFILDGNGKNVNTKENVIKIIY